MKSNIYYTKYVSMFLQFKMGVINLVLNKQGIDPLQT